MMKKILFRGSGWLDEPIEKSGRILDLGAGGEKRHEKVTTMDMVSFPGTDVVHNAEEYPWPFEDASFDYIILSNVFEHIGDLIPFMNEIHRVLAPGGVLRGVTPHFTNPCTYADPTHKQVVSLHLLDWFCEKQPDNFVFFKKILGCDMGITSQFGKPLFKKRRLSLRFREITWPTLAPVWANLFQDFYEVYGSKAIPAWDIFFDLEKID